MGSTFAYDLAHSDLKLETALYYHLTGNHYPPVHSDFIPACVEAIKAVEDYDDEREIKMCNGLMINAYKIVEGLHLWSFVNSHDEDVDSD